MTAIRGADFPRAKEIYDRIIQAYRYRCANTIEGKHLKSVTLIACTFDTVERKADYLHWLFTAIYQKKYKRTPPNITSTFTAYESDIEDLEEPLRAVALEYFRIFVITSRFLPFLVKRIADIESAVRTNGERTSRNSQSTPTDPQNENAHLVQPQSRREIVRKQCRECDGFKCVISQTFDYNEGRRMVSSGQKVPYICGNLEVAHIIPYSINQPSIDEQVIRLFLHLSYNDANANG